MGSCGEAVPTWRLADGTVQTGTRDRRATADRLDLLGTVAAIDPRRATGKTQTDLDRILRPGGKDVDVCTDGTCQGHPVSPFPAVDRFYDASLCSPKGCKGNVMEHLSRDHVRHTTRYSLPGRFGRAAGARSSRRNAGLRIPKPSDNRDGARFVLRRTEHRIAVQVASAPFFTGMPRSASMRRSSLGERPSVVR